MTDEISGEIALGRLNQVSAISWFIDDRKNVKGILSGVVYVGPHPLQPQASSKDFAFGLELNQAKGDVAKQIVERLCGPFYGPPPVLFHPAKQEYVAWGRDHWEWAKDRVQFEMK